MSVRDDGDERDATKQAKSVQHKNKTVAPRTCVCAKSSREPETATLILRGRLANSGFPQRSPVCMSLMAMHTGNVSICSCLVERSWLVS